MGLLPSATGMTLHSPGTPPAIFNAAFDLTPSKPAMF
jgi:hypothetical protein